MAHLTSDDEIAQAIREGKGCLWVDFESPTEEDRASLRNLFNFNALALDECFSHSHHPRLHDYGDYVYLVVHAISRPATSTPAEAKPTDLATAYESQRTPVETGELDVFLGGHFLVTWHNGDVSPIALIRKRALDVPTVTSRGPDRLLAELLDEVADGYVNEVERLNDAIDAAEGRLFKRTGASALREIFQMKKDVVHLRRVLGPQREVINRLARGEFAAVSKEETLFFRDVYDHVYRTTEMLESLRDVLTSALEVYLTITANRTNEIMKVLTICSIVIMSASLVAGIYGMNIDLPRVGGHGDFYILLLVMAVIGVCSIVWFRKRRWI